MKKLVMGCAIAGLIALCPKSEARSPSLPGPSPRAFQVPRGEVGVASWYGIERQGMPTASGELFDKDKLTAAHRKLPLGATVRVTNLKNRQSAMLRINDRGPGIGSRVMNVSWAAAKRLGFVDAGLARVEIDALTYPNNCLRHVASLRSPKLN